MSWMVACRSLNYLHNKQIFAADELCYYDPTYYSTASATFFVLFQVHSWEVV